MRCPMIPLAIGVAILNLHTRFTRLETDAPILAALGAAVDRRIVPIAHRPPTLSKLQPPSVA